MVEESRGVSLTPDIETASERYATRFRGEVGTFFLQLQQRLVLDAISEALAGSLAGRSVLDIGGGHNQVTPGLIEQGCRVVTHGTDVSCASRHAKQFVGEPFVVSSFLRLPFPNKSVDVVVALRFLAHIEDWRSFLSECCRVAKTAVVVDYAPREGFNLLTPVLYQLKKRIEKTTRPYLCHWSADLQREFTKLGAKSVAVRKEMFMPMGVHRGVSSRKFSETVERVSRSLGLTKLFGSPAIISARF